MSKKHPLQQSYVIGIWREFPNNPLLLLFLVCVGFLLFLCGKLLFKKKKMKEKKTRLLFTDWKITAFYTTEILS